MRPIRVNEVVGARTVELDPSRRRRVEGWIKGFKTFAPPLGAAPDAVEEGSPDEVVGAGNKNLTQNLPQEIRT